MPDPAPSFILYPLSLPSHLSTLPTFPPPSAPPLAAVSDNFSGPLASQLTPVNGREVARQKRLRHTRRRVTCGTSEERIKRRDPSTDRIVRRCLQNKGSRTIYRLLGQGRAARVGLPLQGKARSGLLMARSGWRKNSARIKQAPAGCCDDWRTVTSPAKGAKELWEPKDFGTPRFSPSF